SGVHLVFNTCTSSAQYYRQVKSIAETGEESDRREDFNFSNITTPTVQMRTEILSNIVVILCLNLNHSLAVEYFKYDARQVRSQPDSGGQLSLHEKRSAIVYDLRCPKQEYIHPCDCLELDKRETEFEGSGGGDVESGTTGPPNVGFTIEEAIHPDLIETVAFCKNIRNVQVLTDAIKGFQGHRINYFVLDGCKLPPFPNSLFNDVNILWMEILNSTLQFHENYFNTKACP
ncbi:unnamed protein product, partial [Medioppia subpectinata]